MGSGDTIIDRLTSVRRQLKLILRLGVILRRMEKPETPPQSKAPASFHIRNDAGRPGMAIRRQHNCRRIVNLERPISHNGEIGNERLFVKCRPV